MGGFSYHRTAEKIRKNNLVDFKPFPDAKVNI